MYVDLTPVRAAMAEGPDQSPHTSAYDRIHGKFITDSVEAGNSNSPQVKVGTAGELAWSTQRPFGLWGTLGTRVRKKYSPASTNSKSLGTASVAAFCGDNATDELLF